MSVRRWLQAEFAGLLDLLFPPACPLCGTELPLPAPATLCPACQAGIRPLASPCCPRCALPYPTDDGTDHLCEPCLREAPPFAWARAAGIYEGTLRQAVRRFKFRGALGLDRTLGRLLAEALEAGGSWRPDLIVPVPLHPARLRQRTFNQSLLLGRQLGRRWHLPVAPRLLRRTRATPPMPGLRAEARQRNLRGAFALRRELHGERILLVDDVLTTGATARECSRVLLQGGAAEVAVAVVARARRHQL